MVKSLLYRAASSGRMMYIGLPRVSLEVKVTPPLFVGLIVDCVIPRTEMLAVTSASLVKKCLVLSMHFPVHLVSHMSAPGPNWAAIASTVTSSLALRVLESRRFNIRSTTAPQCISSEYPDVADVPVTVVACKPYPIGHIADVPGNADIADTVSNPETLTGSPLVSTWGVCPLSDRTPDRRSDRTSDRRSD
jgi:hypothetical protein